MGWKFWQKNEESKSVPSGQGRRLPRAKELPNEVGRHLVVEKGYEPDWVWSLRSVARPAEQAQNRFEIRIFSPETASLKGILVKNYTSLDLHPELILFAGWYDKTTRRVHLENLLEKAG